MDINVKFDFVEGSFNTETDEIVCVKNTTHNTVELCFKSNMYIPFAKVKLYSGDLLIDAKEVINDAYNLGNEITKRWNVHHELVEALIESNKLIDWLLENGDFNSVLESAYNQSINQLASNEDIIKKALKYD